MICIVDYGVGNLFSLAASFSFIGKKCVVSGDPEVIKSSPKIVLPGVGAFRDAAEKLKKNHLDEAVKKAAAAGKPLLGICLGMQLLFDKSYEFGEFEGLSLIKGDVVPLKGVIPEELDIPHIGWNALHFTENRCGIFKYNSEGEHVYFVHSYYASNCAKSITATTEYGAEITAAVAEDNIIGVQFHPEKSGEAGLKMLRAFAEM